MQWIKIKDRKPEVFKSVFLMTPYISNLGKIYYKIDIGFMWDDLSFSFKYYIGEEARKATFWCPVPNFPIDPDEIMVEWDK
jgi:hypothetical protein